MEQEELEALKTALLDRLRESGEANRLLRILKQRLVSVGWDEDVRQLALDDLARADTLDTRASISRISEEAADLVPDAVRNELIDSRLASSSSLETLDTRLERPTGQRSQTEARADANPDWHLHMLVALLIRQSLAGLAKQQSSRELSDPAKVTSPIAIGSRLGTERVHDVQAAWIASAVSTLTLSILPLLYMPVQCARLPQHRKRITMPLSAQRSTCLPDLKVWMAGLSVDEQYELITRRLQEVLGGAAIRTKLEASRESGQPVRLYWGTATTGRPHVGYLVPLAKIADFLRAGLHVKVLLADVHAFLDNLKAPIELINHRVDFYRRVLLSVLRSIGVETDKLEFVTGSSYQYGPKYNMDKYKLCAITSEHDAKRAGAEVVKQTTSAPLSGLLYPLLQALDEEYLGVDIQFGGVDQRKIFIYAEEHLPKLGYAQRAHLMNAMVPGLAGGKMSSSDPNSKIDFLDGPKDVAKKLKAALAAPGIVEGNGVLAFIKAVVMPISSLKLTQLGKSPFAHADAPPATLLTVERPDQYGGTRHYSDYDALEKDYASEDLHPKDIKDAVTVAINHILEPVQAEFATDKSWQEIDALAYPPPVKVVKSKKPKTTKEEYERLKSQQASSSTADDGQITLDSVRAAADAISDVPIPDSNSNP
ncbi:uncharacterized protein L969DRAFT_49979 [Mixia osmundae IAM 14324]|uniref:Tyrosine--tRNA ligase n=1 Tax=Mixia osmundae (strain CBS 9802 / IAM 14324 / JCM 22182 / KY 12970) TaxID=764103 RepID=G7DYZ0_MIXOS|nr:uncharacterized protein L969DRAFT_49979 [Mixia osmundae IAM 14324]KEI38631.1 hypothetical protein L969DRAFT_49979 [Mixia osmundae IAM 14324]GAA95800.1 hypothetical protein E5Q_02457 [Mixia osmundae IAM 14324]